MGARVKNSKGFSLIELMFSLVFIMISMLAMLTAIIMATRTNLQNDLRNTAVRLTNQTAEVLLTLPFNDIELEDGSRSRIPGDAAQDDKGFPPTAQTVRSHQQTYQIEWNTITQTTDVKEITITVSYLHTSTSKTHSNFGVVYKHRSI